MNESRKTKGPPQLAAKALPYSAPNWRTRYVRSSREPRLGETAYGRFN